MGFSILNVSNRHPKNLAKAFWTGFIYSLWVLNLPYKRSSVCVLQISSARLQELIFAIFFCNSRKVQSLLLPS